MFAFHVPERCCVEVEQWWGEVRLAHALLGAGSPGGAAVERLSVGWGQARRWRCLGVDMGPSPRWLWLCLAPLAAVTGLVEFELVRDAAFGVPPEAGDGEAQELIRRTASGAVVTVPPGWRLDGGGGSFRLSQGPFAFVFRIVPRPARIGGRLGGDPAPADMAVLLAAAGLAAGLALAAVLRVEHHRELVDVSDPPSHELLLERPPELDRSGIFLGYTPDPIAVRLGDGGGEASRWEAQEAPSPALRVASRREPVGARVDGSPDGAGAGVLGVLDAFSSLDEARLDPTLERAARTLSASHGSVIGLDGLGGERRGFGCEGARCEGLVEGLGGIGMLGPGRSADEEARAERPEIEPESSGFVIACEFGGMLERYPIDEIVRQSLPQIRYCYQRGLQRRPTLSGKVVIRFTVAPDGKIRDVGVASTTLGDPLVEACIVARFERMVFPEYGREVGATYPLLLHGP